MHYGYLLIFVLLMLGIVGVPVPDELLLMYLGFDCRRGRLLLPVGIPVATAATICGITVSFLIGRWLGPLVIHRFGRYLGIGQGQVERAGRWFSRVGQWALVIGFFIPGMRHVTALAAGGAKMDWRRFALFAYGGAAIWATGFILTGYFLGSDVPAITARLHPFIRGIELAILGAIALVVLVRLLGNRLKWVQKKPKDAQKEGGAQ